MMGLFIAGCILIMIAITGYIIFKITLADEVKNIGVIAIFVGGIGLIAAIGSTMIYVPEISVGVVTKKFGVSLPQGHVIARNGECGTQADILSPGWSFWMWPWVYEVKDMPVTEIGTGQVGTIAAADGKPLTTGDIFAPAWEKIEDMLDPKLFLASGYKGPQLTVLPPGKYRLNPLLYLVTVMPALDVPIGQVWVVKANAGKSPSETDILEMVNGVPIVPNGFRGVWKNPLLPNMYYLHPLAYQTTEISTSNRVYEYAEMADKNMSDAIMVRSSDGFTFPVDVRCAVNIDAEDAAHIAAMLATPDAMVRDGEDKGRICVLEARCILPTIRALLRNIAEKQTAFQFVDQRSDVEKQATADFNVKMKEYHIKSEGIFIGQIDFDHNPQVKALMQTRTDKEVAVNQQKMYVEQEKAQNQRSSLVSAQESADQQKNLVAAQYEVKIQNQRALARAQEAEGEASYINITFAARQKSYLLLSEAIGKENVTMLEILKIIKEGNVRITPDVMVTGGGDILDALAGTLLRPKPAKTE